MNLKSGLIRGVSFCERDRIKRGDYYTDILFSLFLLLGSGTNMVASTALGMTDTSLGSSPALSTVFSLLN